LYLINATKVFLLSIYSVKICNCVLGSFSIFSGAFQDKKRVKRAEILDTEDPENNSFWVVNQLLVKENNNEGRFDVVVFVNGLPLVFVELKSGRFPR
jgi:hypothetical protein